MEHDFVERAQRAQRARARAVFSGVEDFYGPSTNPKFKRIYNILLGALSAREEELVFDIDDRRSFAGVLTIVRVHDPWVARALRLMKNDADYCFGFIEYMCAPPDTPDERIVRFVVDTFTHEAFKRRGDRIAELAVGCDSVPLLQWSVDVLRATNAGACLRQAISRGKRSSIRFLLDRVVIRDDILLMVAAELGDLETIQRLIAKGAPPRGWKPLRMAARSGQGAAPNPCARLPLTRFTGM